MAPTSLMAKGIAKCYISQGDKGTYSTLLTFISETENHLYVTSNGMVNLEPSSSVVPQKFSKKHCRILIKYPSSNQGVNK